MKRKFISFISKPWWSFIGFILATFAFFGISSGNFITTFGKYTWIIDATKWSLILGAFLFAIHGYLRAEKNRKNLINVKTSAYDEAYKHFTNQLSYAIGRYKVYSSNLAPEEKRYTEVGVMERINEVKSTRLQLLSVCGEHVRSILLAAGTDWLEDIHSFGKTAPSIMQKLSETAFKDRT
jgi:hypothetical protein